MALYPRVENVDFVQCKDENVQYLLVLVQFLLILVQYKVKPVQFHFISVRFRAIRGRFEVIRDVENMGWKIGFEILLGRRIRCDLSDLANGP